MYFRTNLLNCIFLVNLQKSDIVIVTEVLSKYYLDIGAHFCQLSVYNIVHNKHWETGGCIYVSSLSDLKHAKVNISFTSELSEVISVEVKMLGYFKM